MSTLRYSSHPHTREFVYTADIEGGQPPGILRQAGDRIEHVLGYSQAEFLQKPDLWFSLIHPDDFPAVLGSIERLLKTGLPVTRLYRVRHGRTGEYRLLDDQATPVSDAAGHITGYEGSAFDVTGHSRTAETDLEQVRLLLDSSGLGTWDVDLCTGAVTWNETVFHALGYPPAPGGTATADLWRSLVHPDDLPRVEEEYGKALSTRSRFVSEHRIRRADTGETRWIGMTAQFQYSEAGKAFRMLGISFDNTERTRAEEALRAGTERQTLLLRSIPMAFYTARATGDMETTWISEQIEQITGFAPSRFVAHPQFWSERLHPDDRERAIREFEITREAGSTASEYRWLCADGTFHWFLDLGVFISGVQEPAGEIIGAWLDITERKNTERALIESRDRMTKLNACLVSFGADPDENIDRLVTLCGVQLGASAAVYNRLEGESLVPVGRWNTGTDRLLPEPAHGHICHDVILRQSPEPLVLRNLGESVYSTTDPNVRRYGLKTYVGKAVARGDSYVGSLCVLYREDRVPTEEDLGLLGIAGAAIGVEEKRRHAEERASMLSHTIRSISELVSITDLDNRLLYVNDAFLAAYGFSEDELIGQPVTIVRSPNDHVTTVPVILGATKSGGWQGELLNRRKDGTDFPISLSTSVVRDTRGNAIALVGIAQDITDRKRAEEQLTIAEQRYRTLFDENLAGIYISTPEGRLIACNPSFARIFRFESVEEALSTNTTSLYTAPEARRAFLDQLRREKKMENYELNLIRRDGTPAYILENIVGKFDDQGNLVEIHGYLFDETKRRELEKQLIQSQKLQGVGTLAGGIAHDFNNILGIIIGNTSLLQHAQAEPADFSHRIEAIQKAAQRGAALVKQLLTFARKSEPVVEPVQINDIVGEISRLLHETFPRTIAVTTRPAADLPVITADAAQIHQVLLNLCVNARDAMPEGGTLSISTGRIAHQTLAERFPEAKSREHVLLEVADTGTGMDEATKSRMFEPFFTTKGPGRGTGLGLSSVFGTVETHEGFIAVSSDVGKGTTVSIYLPAATYPTGKSPRAAAAPVQATPGGTETILLIEDEEMLAELLTSALVSKGYRVLRARDGQEGVDTFVENERTIDLVVSDLGLPVLGGAEVFRRIRKKNPGMRIILASGYLDPEVKAGLQEAGAVHFVQKPYSVPGVLQTIREVLDQNS